ncbi:MAG: DUF1698 domain-containing protein, partial [Patescibacteria group bacterium]|nr:DUF1698 domain-containing protein [Patescibacteria group bacterium]
MNFAIMRGYAMDNNTLKSGNILNYYFKSSPSSQNALDIFKNEWTSKFPSPLIVHAGVLTLFEDPRIEWAISKLGDITGKTVLELGPLEGGHTYMLEKEGAASILAIESNSKAFLKCLITKEILGLQKSKFLLGDFMEYLKVETTKFDVCIASGVLYHMENPTELIDNLSKITDNIFLWTHYYDDNFISNNAAIKRKFSQPIERDYKGFKHKLHRQEYGSGLKSASFCGGLNNYSHWMSKKDILD